MWEIERRGRGNKQKWREGNREKLTDRLTERVSERERERKRREGEGDKKKQTERHMEGERGIGKDR